MTGINYVTNGKGENTGLLIDLEQLRSKDSDADTLKDLFEDLEDIIAVELNKGEKGRPYDEVRKEILKG